MFSALRRPSAPDTISIAIGIFDPILTRRVTPRQVVPPHVKRISGSVLIFRVSRNRIYPELFKTQTRRLGCKPSVSVEWQLNPERVHRKFGDSPETRNVPPSVLAVFVTTTRINLKSFPVRTRRLGFRPSVKVESHMFSELKIPTASVDTSLPIPFTTSFDVSLSASTDSRQIPQNQEVEVYHHKSGKLRIAAPVVKSIPMVIKSPRTLGAIYYRFEATPIDRAASVSRGEASKPRIVEAKSIDSLFYILLAKRNWDARIADLDSLLAAYPPGKTPYPFQFEGIQFLFAKPRALLADEMGLGKTIQAILSMRARIHSGKVQRVLIVCPKSLLPTWEREINEWAPELSVTIVHGVNRKRSLARKHHVYVTNYESVSKEICNEHGWQRPTIPEYDLLIVDEIQNLKNISTVRTRAVIAVKAKQRWGLTGTPMENSFDDYRTIWRVIDPESVNQRLDQKLFVRWTQSNVLRREKASVMKDLPETTTQVVYVDLEGAQRSKYRHLQSQSNKDAGEECRKRGPNSDIALRGYLLGLISKLKQQCVIDEETSISAKVEWIRDHLSAIKEETHGKEKLLLFTQFPDLAVRKWRLLNEFSEFRPMVYYGGTSLKDRNTFVERFEADDQCKMALVGIMAGGTGLTLTRANHLVFLDQWWNPSVMAQAAARIHRIGQTRTCTVTYLLARGTIEDTIHAKLERKHRDACQLFRELTSAGSPTAEDFSDFHNSLSIEDLLEALGVSRSQP